MSESHNLSRENFPKLNEENAGYEGLLMLGRTPAEAEKILKELATDEMTIQIFKKLAESKSGRDMLREQWEEWIKREVHPPFLAALTAEQIELIRSGK